MAKRRHNTASGELLRAALRRTGLPIRELARRSKTDAGIVLRFLNGERGITLPTMDRLAAAVGMAFKLVRLRAGKGR